MMKMGSWVWVCVLGYTLIAVQYTKCVIGQNTNSTNITEQGRLFVDGKNVIGQTDDDFICATLDWWPPDKCDYGNCSWGNSSLLNLDLNNQTLFNAVKGFTPLKIRLGGTLEDQLIYNTSNNNRPCTPFVKNTSEMFGFNPGCLPLNRWDELNSFFNKTGAVIVFGLNALAGRTFKPDNSSDGAWDPTNAKTFIEYTVSKDYSIHGWEFGTKVEQDQYSRDTPVLQQIVQYIYKRNNPKIIAPGGFFDENWFQQYVNATPKLDAISHHIYNLGSGVDGSHVEKITDPSYLDGAVDTFSKLYNIIKSSGTSAGAWVGEAGGAFNSGAHLVSNAFVNSFWYLDQLGMVSNYDIKTYCRQTLIGGNYGLLNTTTFVPNPDYYSALLWHRLMGTKALATRFYGTKKLRTYTHCAKGSDGITILLINLDNSTTVQINSSFSNELWQQSLHQANHNHHHQQQRSKVTRFPFKVHRKLGATTRQEYHLTANEGNLHSQTMLLNGNPLTVDSNGQIPSLTPQNKSSWEPITVAPYSIVFVQLPVVVPACRRPFGSYMYELFMGILDRWLMGVERFSGE